MVFHPWWRPYGDFANPLYCSLVDGVPSFSHFPHISVTSRQYRILKFQAKVIGKNNLCCRYWRYFHSNCEDSCILYFILVKVPNRPQTSTQTDSSILFGYFYIDSWIVHHFTVSMRQRIMYSCGSEMWRHLRLPR